jgi:acyl carrier protein
MNPIDHRVFQVFNRTVSDACLWEDWQRLNSLQEWTGLDSMAILEFMVGLEKEFGIRFPPDDLEHSLFTSRARLVRYLSDRGLTES